MPLSDAAVRTAKPKEKPYKITDSGGLFLLVTPSGGKLWRFKYRFNGAEKLLALGVYPEIGLKQARERHNDAKKLLANGVDPSADKKRQALAATLSASNTFDSIAAEFIELKEREGLSQATLVKQKWFRSQMQAGIGDRPVAEIEPMEVLAALKIIEKRGNYETSKRCRAFADRIFRYAIITGRAKTNPAAGLGDALISGKVKHHAAIIDPKGVGELLRGIEAYEGSILTKLSMKMLAHVFVRPGELRHAEWSEIDFDRSVWLIPAAKMKMRSDHAVPLSAQVLAILEEAKALRIGKGRYVFPSLVSALKPMSENTVNMGLRRLGYTNEEMTAHGFRSTASTLLNESGKWSSDAIERALAHKDSDAIRSIYHRGKHWDERVLMAQWWSDYLDRLRDGGEVVPLRREG